MVEWTECVGKSYSMWGFGWSRWDWMECVYLICRCVVFSRTIYYMIYYARLLYLKIVFCSLLSCVISWAYTGFLRGVFVFFRTWGVGYSSSASVVRSDGFWYICFALKNG